MFELLFVIGAITVAAVALWLRSRRQGQAQARTDDIGERVVVGVARPATAGPLSKVGAALARPVGGAVTPLTVVTAPEPSSVDRSGAQSSVRHCEAMIREEGVEASGRVRIATSLSDGVLHGLVEHRATALVLGWPSIRDTGRFTSELEEIVARSPVPVLVARLDHARWDRIVLQVPSEPLTPGLRASLRFATRVAERLGTRHGIEAGYTQLVTPSRRDSAQLFIAPVAPEPAALPRATARLAAHGDVILALCHGSRAVEDRPLSASSNALYHPEDTGELDLRRVRRQVPSDVAVQPTNGVGPHLDDRLGSEKSR